MRMGVQMIGQSFEQITRDNYYLQSRFLESGGTQCGYLLKPKWMHSECDHKAYPKNFQNPVHLLVFNVLLGQNCAINGSLGEVHSLEVYVRGNRKDQEVNKHYVLEQLKVEYYTQFNLECEFTVHCPELFCIVIDLLDGQRKVRASRTVCLRYLREGLRPVFLLDEDLKETPNSYLIVFAQKKEIQKKINNFFEFK